MEFLITIGNHQVIDEKTVNEVVNKIEDNLAKAKELDIQLRTKLLESMIKADAAFIKLPTYTISLLQPKDEMEFNVEKFIEEQPQDILEAFVTVETKEEFDMEKFKKENPLLYRKYIKVKDIPNVNIKKLEKSLPSLAKKYIKYIKTEGKTSIRIVKNKDCK